LATSFRCCKQQAKNLERGGNLETGKKAKYLTYAEGQLSESFMKSLEKVMSGESVRAFLGYLEKNPQE
jgi:hypothetical protein